MPTKKIYTNTFAQIGAKLLTALISIVMIKLVTNLLDVAGYGLYSKLYNYLSIFAVIADLGLYTITVREISAQNDEKMREKIAGNVLSLRTISGLIIIVLALVIAYFLPGYNTRESLYGVVIVGVFTLLGLINSSIMSYLQAILKTEFTLISTTLGKLVTLGIVAYATFVPMLWFSHSERLAWVLIAGVAGNLVMTTLTWWYANRHTRIWFAWDTDYIRHIIRISLPYGLALFLNVIFFKVDTILLSVITPKTDADTVVALYALPMKLVEVGMMYGTIFLNSLLPVLTLAFEKSDHEKVKKLIRHAALLMFSGGLLASLVFSLAALPITRIISSEAFIHTVYMGMSSVDALRIVAWIFLVYSLSSLSTYILIARGEQKKMLTINAIIALMNIVGNIILIPHWSFIGSAWVTLGTQVLLLLATTWSVRKVFH